MVSDTVSSSSEQTEYSLVTGKHNYEELGSLTVYGIKARLANAERTVNDVSLNETTVMQLISFLKENKVEIYHFESVIEDMLISDCFE